MERTGCRPRTGPQALEPTRWSALPVGSAPSTPHSNVAKHSFLGGCRQPRTFQGAIRTPRSRLPSARLPRSWDPSPAGGAAGPCSARARESPSVLARGGEARQETFSAPRRRADRLREPASTARDAPGPSVTTSGPCGGTRAAAGTLAAVLAGPRAASAWIKRIKENERKQGGGDRGAPGHTQTR